MSEAEQQLQQLKDNVRDSDADRKLAWLKGQLEMLSQRVDSFQKVDLTGFFESSECSELDLLEIEILDLLKKKLKEP